MNESTITIDEVMTVSREVADAISGLLPQLTSQDAGFNLQSLEEIVASPASRLLVARLPDGRIAGMLSVAIYPVPTGRHAIIEDVVVDESARGYGIGAALVRAGIELAEQAGAAHLDLTSSPSREAANRLYLRLGFEQRATNVYRYRI